MDAAGPKGPLLKCARFVDQVGSLFQYMASNVFVVIYMPLCINAKLNSWVFFSHVPTLEEYQKLCIQIPDGNGGVQIPVRVPGAPDISGIYPFPFPGQPNGRGEGPGVPEISIPGRTPYQPPPGMLLFSACLLNFLQFYTPTRTPTSRKFQHDVYFQLL